MRLTIGEVRDRAMILDCLNRYAQGVDQRNWPLYESAFTADAAVEVIGYLNHTVTPIEFRDLLCGTFDATRLSGQHFLGNTLFEIDGDTAHTVTEFMAVTLEHAGEPGAAARQITAALYIDDLTRVADGWKIARRTLVRKSSNEDALPFADPFAAAIEATLKTGWPLAPYTQDQTLDTL